MAGARRPGYGGPMDASLDPRWRAVLDRDPAAAFVYAVTSTGVFCRPCCPSRRPRPERVRFFDTPDQARAAGFRPCLRCRPEERGDPRLEAARAALDAALDAGGPAPSLADLARAAGLSAGHFQRLFSARYGLSPKRYALARRTRTLAQELGHGRDVEGALAQAGFGSSSRVYERAGLLGMTPGRLRRGGAGETVRHVLGPTALGLMLLAATDAGVCAVEFGDDPEALLQALQRRFPRAALEPGGEREQALLAAVARAAESGSGVGALPLDLRGTAFQLEVWRALRGLAPGERVGYGELAARLGRPGSARAVARAVAGNPAAVAVPCHRVVGADGSLTGYRWGLARKKELLERERAAQALPEPEYYI